MTPEELAELKASLARIESMLREVLDWQNWRDDIDVVGPSLENYTPPEDNSDFPF